MASLKDGRMLSCLLLSPTALPRPSLDSEASGASAGLLGMLEIEVQATLCGNLVSRSLLPDQSVELNGVVSQSMGLMRGMRRQFRSMVDRYPRLWSEVS